MHLFNVGIETSTPGFQIQWSTNWTIQADWVYGSKLPNKNVTTITMNNFLCMKILSGPCYQRNQMYKTNNKKFHKA